MTNAMDGVGFMVSGRGVATAKTRAIVEGGTIVAVVSRRDSLLSEDSESNPWTT